MFKSKQKELQKIQLMCKKYLYYLYLRFECCLSYIHIFILTLYLYVHVVDKNFIYFLIKVKNAYVTSIRLHIQSTHLFSFI